MDVIELQRLQDAEIEIPIIGITPLIVQSWSEKAKSAMRQKQQKPGVRAKRTAKEPEQEANEAMYWLNGKGKRQPAFPASAFKAASVGGCRFFDGLPMTKAKTLFFVTGQGPEQLVPILDGSYKKAPELELHEDTPRNADGVVDLRYRYYINEWATVLPVRFISGAINADSIVNLVDAGGRGGVGSWRPSAPKSATGTYGQYRVDLARLGQG